MPTTVHTSKFLSLILRHKPETIGIKLSHAGWCRIEDLLKAAYAHGHNITRDAIDDAVINNDKKRFEISEDGKCIRASQGHSIEVDLQYEPVEPPSLLYHGTATRFLDSIKASGLVKGSRHHVHLSSDINTAMKVGERHGKPVVIPVAALEMYHDGHKFFNTPNGVWLVTLVPPKFLHFDALIHTTVA